MGLAAGDIDRLLHSPPAAGDPYPQQHGAQQQMPAVSRIQRRRKLNTDLLVFRSFCEFTVNICAGRLSWRTKDFERI